MPPLHLELTTADSIDRSAASFVAAQCEVEVLFINASLLPPAPSRTSPRRSGLTSSRPTSSATWSCCASCFAPMRSVLGIVPMPNRAAYSASKAAMESVADSQRIKLAHRGIHVCLVQPGPILTSFRRNSLASLLAHVDVDLSRYAEEYKATIARLCKEGPASPGTLPAEAVASVVVAAATARKPRHRYPVTRNTKVIASIKRALPSWALDRVIRRAAGREVLPTHTGV